MKQGVRVKTPVTRNLRSLFKEPLPREPVIVHFSADEWSKLCERIPASRRKIAEDAKGMFVVPDPFGGFLGFLACAAGSGEGEACLPEIVRTGGTITFGTGCTCIRGKDPVDPPVREQDSCALGISVVGGLTCVGTCSSSGRKCQLVRKPSGSGGRMFVTCECS
jgi:hypothetical protein